MKKKNFIVFFLILSAGLVFGFKQAGAQEKTYNCKCDLDFTITQQSASGVTNLCKNTLPLRDGHTQEEIKQMLIGDCNEKIPNITVSGNIDKVNKLADLSYRWLNDCFERKITQPPVELGGGYYGFDLTCKREAIVSAPISQPTNNTSANGTCSCGGEASYGLLSRQVTDALKASCNLNQGVITGDGWCSVKSFSFPSKLEDCPSDNTKASEIFFRITKPSSIAPAGENTGSQFRMSCEWSQERASPLAGTSAKELQATALSKLNPAGISAPVTLINRAIRGLMAFIGSVTLVLYIWSGFLWMTASGNTEQVGKAKKIMVWTTLGAAMMLASYVLASFLFSAIPN